MIQDKLIPVNLEQEMKKSFIAYAMAVIVDRALPDVRDGLKPVQRRILYAAMKMGATADKQTKKCATIVGETMMSDDDAISLTAEVSRFSSCGSSRSP